MSHSPLTNSDSTLTPTPSMLYPQIQNSPDLLLQIPNLKYKILFPHSLQRAERKSSLPSLISLPFPPSPTQRGKPKNPTKKKNQKNSKNCRDSVIREDSNTIRKIQTSTGAITKGKQQHSQQRRARIEKSINQKSQKRKVNPKTSVSSLCIQSLPSVKPVSFTRSRATTCDLTRHHGHGS
ncbi:hypothetical protein ACB092_11G143800 [Castanea dentata]